MMNTSTRILVALMALALTGAACGSPDQSEPASGTPTTTAPAATSPATPPAAPAADEPAVHDGRPVEITADDTMKFSVGEIRAKAGERLSVTLINKGTMPKFSMGHNWLVLTLSSDVDAFVAAAAEAPTTDYVPASRRAEILASTKLLGPAEQDTVTFTVPDAPGRYPFLCSFPGHYQVGMRGVLIVE